MATELHNKTLVALNNIEPIDTMWVAKHFGLNSRELRLALHLLNNKLAEYKTAYQAKLKQLNEEVEVQQELLRDSARRSYSNPLLVRQMSNSTIAHQHAEFAKETIDLFDSLLSDERAKPLNSYWYIVQYNNDILDDNQRHLDWIYRRVATVEKYFTTVKNAATKAVDSEPEIVVIDNLDKLPDENSVLQAPTREWPTNLAYTLLTLGTSCVALGIAASMTSVQVEIGLGLLGIGLTLLALGTIIFVANEIVELCKGTTFFEEKSEDDAIKLKPMSQCLEL